jgi:small GTP-binding protein
VIGEKKKKSKSQVIGLRVRSNSTKDGNGSVYPRSSVESNALNDPSEHFDYFYKIIIIGDEFVGKTNFLLRCAKGFYDPKPKTTFGVEFLFRSLDLPDSNQTVKAQIWDTSGAKEFLAITTTHYRFAVGAFLVYDVTNIQSFLNLQDWLHKIREFSDPDVVVALVGNKADLVDDDDRINNYGKY